MVMSVLADQIFPASAMCLSVHGNAVKHFRRGREVWLSQAPLPPNRACGFPAHGSPVSSLRIDRNGSEPRADYRDPLSQSSH